MTRYFLYDERLKIKKPDLKKDWDDYSAEEQLEIVTDWEKIRGGIPDRIVELEREINIKQALLNNESSFEQSCLINNEIAELASIINDLQILYRQH